MPDDTSRAAEVSDPKLIELARAGENWRCPYCQSDARDLHGECARCGGPRAHAARALTTAGVQGAARRVAASLGRASPRVWAALAAVPLIVVAGFLIQRSLRRFDAKVRGYGYNASFGVSQKLPLRREGFAEQRPATATAIEALGDRVHHYDKIPIGHKEESYQDKVSDGSTTETYSEREACGQTCSSSPRSCRNVCKSGKNGFATCNEVCTGGGQTCTTKYCSVTKTRSVPKYKWVTKTRTVQVYKSEPVYAPYFAWTVTDWASVRWVSLSGDGNVIAKPTLEQVGLPADLPPDSVQLGTPSQPNRWVELEYRRRGVTHRCMLFEPPERFSVGQEVEIELHGSLCLLVGNATALPLAPQVPGTVKVEWREVKPPAPPPPPADAGPGADEAGAASDASPDAQADARPDG